MIVPHGRRKNKIAGATKIQFKNPPASPLGKGGTRDGAAARAVRCEQYECYSNDTTIGYTGNEEQVSADDDG